MVKRHLHRLTVIRFSVILTYSVARVLVNIDSNIVAARNVV